MPPCLFSELDTTTLLVEGLGLEPRNRLHSRQISNLLQYHYGTLPNWWKTEESNPTRIATGPDFQDQSPACPAASSSVIIPVTESGAGLWFLRLLELTHP